MLAVELARPSRMTKSGATSFGYLRPGAAPLALHEAPEVINLVAREGIASGCGYREFCPKANVTRSQMAAFLHRAFGPLGAEEPAVPAPPDRGPLPAPEAELRSVGCLLPGSCPNTYDAPDPFDLARGGTRRAQTDAPVDIASV